MSIERKLLSLDITGFKFDGESGEFEGYASVFGGKDSYGDTIQKGAFAKTLENRNRPVRMRWNHFGPVIGKYTEMYEDEKGLHVKGQLTPGHSVANDVRASLAHGAIDGLSIGFFLNDYSNMEGGGRDIRSVDLVEISVVEEPADLAAKITSIKSAVDQSEKLSDLELILRDAGFSRAEATAFVSRVKSIYQRDIDKKQIADRLADTIKRFKI
jgi:HK97 family phage prohead protease